MILYQEIIKKYLKNETVQTYYKEHVRKKNEKNKNNEVL